MDENRNVVHQVLGAPSLAAPNRCVRRVGWFIHTLTLPQHIHTQVALAAVQKSVAVDVFMVVIMFLQQVPALMCGSGQVGTHHKVAASS